MVSSFKCWLCLCAVLVLPLTAEAQPPPAPPARPATVANTPDIDAHRAVAESLDMDIQNKQRHSYVVRHAVAMKIAQTVNRYRDTAERRRMDTEHGLRIDNKVRKAKSSLLGFIFRSLIFDFIYSFGIGFVAAVITAPAFVLSKLKKPDSPFAEFGPGIITTACGVMVGLAACVLQGTIVAAAAVAALQIDGSRSSLVWYGLGFAFSAPIALVKALGDPRDKYSHWGILLSEVSYVFVCIFPRLIPSAISQVAEKLLLGE